MPSTGAHPTTPRRASSSTICCARATSSPALWERHEIASADGKLKRFVHPLVGGLTLHCQILISEHNITERLVVFTAAPGSEDAQRLELLSVIGSQDFSPAPDLGTA